MRRKGPVRVISYAKLQHRYGGKFIARQDGEVLASGKTYREVLQAIRRRHLDRQALTIGFVPPNKAICIYVLHAH